MVGYQQPWQRFTLYEIDPVVKKVAETPEFFTFLSGAPAGSYEIILGDARLKIEDAADAAYDAIFLDAFSSDAVPVHLITREALDLYLRKLGPRGILTFNISNRYIDLSPVLGDLGNAAGMVCFTRLDDRVSEEERAQGKLPSHYVLMARDAADIEPLVKDSRWQRLERRPGAALWTDDFSNILSVLK
jgi:spermidine synthase